MSDDEYESGSITGPDSEEILEELCRKFAPRDIVELVRPSPFFNERVTRYYCCYNGAVHIQHRAVLQEDVPKIRKLVQEKGIPVDATILPVEVHREVRKCNSLDVDAIQGVTTQSEPYPEIEQHRTGTEGKPNELFPTGEPDEPETNLDILFQTPLLRAAFVSANDSIETLLELGANKSFVSPSGATAISLCIEGTIDSEATERTIILVGTAETICPPLPVGETLDPGSRKYNRYHPLMDALENEGATVDTRIISALLRQGATIPDELLSEVTSGSASAYLPSNIVTVLREHIGQSQ